QGRVYQHPPHARDRLHLRIRDRGSPRARQTPQPGRQGGQGVSDRGDSPCARDRLRQRSHEPFLLPEILTVFAGVRAPLFLLTALLWLIASVRLGLYLWIAKEIGLPSVPHLRVIHAHSALVGGVAQMIFGGLLTFLPPLLMVPDPKKSRIFQYLLLNAGAAGMMIGFGTGNLPVVGFSGMAVGLAFLSLIIDALGMAQKSLSRPGLHLWFYGLAVVALLVGIGLGEMVAFGSFERERISLGRLAHLHLNLIGFVTLTIVGTMHAMFPTVTHAKLHSDRLAIAAFVVLPLGVAGRIAAIL